MMFLLRMLMKRGRAVGMDPLQVSMTGVRMGERFLQVGCRDRALLSGLAAKVGLSGTAAVAVFTRDEATLAQSIGAKVGALIEIHDLDKGQAWPIEEAPFDMIVVDDTGDGFGGRDSATAILRHAFGSVRSGGRIEVVTPIKTKTPDYDFLRELSGAGFKPVRVLAEHGAFRFLEGLRPN